MKLVLALAFVLTSLIMSAAHAESDERAALMGWVEGEPSIATPAPGSILEQGDSRIENFAPQASFASSISLACVWR